MWFNLEKNVHSSFVIVVFVLRHSVDTTELVMCQYLVQPNQTKLPVCRVNVLLQVVFKKSAHKY